MTILSVVRDVCAVVGVNLPVAVFSNINNNRTMQEMVALANEMAQRIAYDTRDWQALRASAGFAGDGIKDHFPLPANFKRLMLTSNHWRGTNTVPMRFIADHDRLTRNLRSGHIGTMGGGDWTISGGFMYVFPVLAVGETTALYYIDKNCVSLASGGYGDVFMADNDTFRLDERLLKLGMIWQWKANKGSPYAEDLGNYSDALPVVAGRDIPAPIIIDRLPLSANASVAYPWPVPTP